MTRFSALSDQSWGGRVTRILLYVGCAAVAAVLVRDGGISSAVRYQDATTAERLGAHSAGALRVEAESALLAGEPGLAISLASAALLHAPLDRRAIRTFALAREKQPHGTDGSGLMNIAAKLSWRDTPAQIWLLQRALIGRDAAASVERIDALLRVNPDQPDLYAVLRELTLLDTGRAALVRHLADRPEWRGRFLGSLSADSPEAASGSVAMLDALRTSPAPPGDEESGPVLAALVQRGYGQPASQLWSRLHASGVRPNANLIDDPDFEHRPSGSIPAGLASPFVWQIRAQGDASVYSGVGPDGRKALVVRDNGAGADLFIYRTVALPPGSYSLSFTVQADATDASRRLWASLRCWPKYTGDNLLRLSSQGSGNAVFDVPSGCDTQRLGFSIRPSDAGEGTTFYLRHINVVALR